MILNLKKINIKETIEEVMVEDVNALAAAQRDQMLHGERSTGKKIGKYKNKKYAAMKYAMSPLAGNGYKDLKLTGSFQDLIIAEPRSTGVVFTSNDTHTDAVTGDSKLDSILNREGEDIFGLNKKYAAQYATKSLKPKANKLFKKLISK